MVSFPAGKYLGHALLPLPASTGEFDVLLHLQLFFFKGFSSITFPSRAAEQDALGVAHLQREEGDVWGWKKPLVSGTAELGVGKSPGRCSQQELMLVLTPMWVAGDKHHLKDRCLSQTETLTPAQSQRGLGSLVRVCWQHRSSQVALLLGTNVGTSLPP